MRLKKVDICYYRHIRKAIPQTVNYGAILLKLHGTFLQEYRANRKLGNKRNAIRYYKSAKYIAKALEAYGFFL